MADSEIPSWEFEIRERPRLVSALFPREEPELTFESTYLDKDRALRRLIRRLNDYDGDTFKPMPGCADA